MGENESVGTKWTKWTKLILTTMDKIIPPLGGYNVLSNQILTL